MSTSEYTCKECGRIYYALFPDTTRLCWRCHCERYATAEQKAILPELPDEQGVATAVQESWMERALKAEARVATIKVILTQRLIEPQAKLAAINKILKQ